MQLLPWKRQRCHAVGCEPLWMRRGFPWTFGKAGWFASPEIPE
jgi:hypothetical protein